MQPLQLIVYAFPRDGGLARFKVSFHILKILLFFHITSIEVPGKPIHHRNTPYEGG